MVDIPILEPIKNEMDEWKMILRAGGVNKGYLERMEAFSMPNYPQGCLVRIIMQLQHADLTWSYNCSMTFIPDAKLSSSPDPEDPGNLIYSLIY